MSDVVFLDTETTGLDPETERIFEVAVIADKDEWVWRLRPEDYVVEQMHPKAVEVNRYHERTSARDWRWDDPVRALDRLRDVLEGKHIVGAVPDFDARFLTAEYRRAGMIPPRWHYHLIDVETLAMGFLASQGMSLPLPWDSDDLSRAIGVESGEHVHEALADARWAKRIFEAVFEGVVSLGVAS